MTQVLCIDHRGSNPMLGARSWPLSVLLLAVAMAAASPARAEYHEACMGGNVTANVVAMDQVITYNRMGAFAPAGMIFALARDVFPKNFAGPFTPANSCASAECAAGDVMLRPDKRPRPLTLRVNEGCQISITLTNLLSAADIQDAANEAPGIQLCEPAGDGTPRPGNNPACQSEQPVTRNVSIHVHGMIPDSIEDDGSNVGENATKQPTGGNSLVAPNDSHTYVLTAKREGAYTITSGPNLGGEGGSGAIASGLFGVLNVEPAGSIWYRSQVTQDDMNAARDTTKAFDCNGEMEKDESGYVINEGKETVGETCGRHPVLDYEAVYSSGPYAGLPILNLVCPAAAPPGVTLSCTPGEIVHNNLNAVIAPGVATGCTATDRDGNLIKPCFPNDPASYELYPNRQEAFREHTIVFHDEVKMVQAFPEWYRQLPFTLSGVKDGFAVNYGTGGVGSEVIGNRLGVGPMHDCAECKYEEFFLTAWAVGDPAMIVDIPANQGLELCDPGLDETACANVGAKATKAFYADDPSNVHHGYINDRTKIRNIHVGTEHHIFHLHAHQWNFATRDANEGRREDQREDWGYDQTNYLDSQGIGPGSSFSYEITFGGGGNRHKQPGDAIFHCHFYPHFAQGMWGLWRVHDVFEIGSKLDSATGKVIERGLPDSEICADGAGGSQCGGYDANGIPIAGGTPVPGVVPLPGKAMAPMPGDVYAALEDSDGDGVPEKVSAEESGKFQGFPFYIAGKAGHRPPTPPTDLIEDGGLPRHIVTSGKESIVEAEQNATSFDKVLVAAKAQQLPEAGTLDERVAMAFHGPQDPYKTGHVAFHDSYRPDGTYVSGTQGFEINGLMPQHSAPYADPCRGDFYNSGEGYTKYGGEANSVDNIGKKVGNERFYAASVIELPAQLNKVGWHYAQQRIIVLDEDVAPSLANERAPEPFVMRGNTNDCIDFNHTNLAPSVYQLDDFQVKTPTDVIGQHIHLVKFDVSSADGAANGWNYEDATLSPHEVQERIHAFKNADQGGAWVGPTALTGAKAFTKACPDATGLQHEGCNGARTTRQRWYIDPGWRGNVFTHDHLGPSTHQQAGLYGVLLVEAEGSKWYDPTTGNQYGIRADGGPTSWRADIHAPYDAYREFFLEFADFQLAYRSWEGRWKDFKDAGGNLLFPREGDGEGGNAVDVLGNPVAINLNGPNQAVNPSYRNEVGLPHVLQSNVSQLPLPVGQPAISGCGGENFDTKASEPGKDQNGDFVPGNSWTGCAPEAISAADPGTFMVNMRNEPIAMRVRDPFKNAQAAGPAGDLAYAYQSRTDRADPRLNTSVGQWPYNSATLTQTANHGALPGDPFTPLLRGYEGDKVMLRVQVGAHEEGHNISINGVRWLQNWQAGASGFRNSQFAGISEYFIFQVPGLQAVSQGPFADYLYQTGSSTDAQWNGSWGLMRAYDGAQGLLDNLQPLPNNPDGKALRMNPGGSAKFCNFGSGPDETRSCGNDADCFDANGGAMQCVGGPTPGEACTRNRDCGRRGQCLAEGTYGTCELVKTDPTPSTFAGVCPMDAPERKYHVVAVRGADVLTTDLDGDLQGDLVYNNTLDKELWDPTALMYVLAEDLDANGKLKPERRVEPLILRAAAGECIFITLTNRFGGAPLDFEGFNTLPMIVHQFNNNQVAPSAEVGLHAQLVEYDMSSSDGMNVGHNPVQTVPVGGTVTYKWYAGRVLLPPEGDVDRIDVPVEFGAINLIPADPIEGASKGLIGAMVIEPKGTFWKRDGERGTDNLLTRAAVTIYDQPATCSHDGSIACERDADCVKQEMGFCSRNTSKQCSSSADCGRREGRCELPPPLPATCDHPEQSKQFRDFVVVHQDNVNMMYRTGAAAAPLPTVSHEEEPEDSGMKGLNYRTDPIWHRLGVGPTAAADVTRAVDYTNAFAGEPQTPVFTTKSGATDRIRLRVLKPGGHNRNHVVTLHGFVWPRYPFSNVDGRPNTEDDSQVIDPTNEYTFWHGEQMGHGPSNHINVVPVGGCPATGDFLYRDMVPVHVDNGQWAIVRCGNDDEVPPKP